MIKLVIFDLDGVLVDAKNIHYQSLNDALGEEFAISLEEHLSTYDGLKTKQKLEMLTEKKGLSKELHQSIWERKQLRTIELLSDISESKELSSLFKYLKEKGLSISVCSNSIRNTIIKCLTQMNLVNLVDLVISNEDVRNSKPHPEMYWNAISHFGISPHETLIVEDSPHGLLAAHRSKANVMRVKTVEDVNLVNIKQELDNFDDVNEKFTPKWIDKNLNVVIPMAGAGSRFSVAGYTFPKPLIEVNGKPMIQVVVENLNITANFIFIVQKSHSEKYNLKTLLNLIAPGCKVIEIEGVTEGAACTALLAKEFINNDKPLFFANSDQYVEWDSSEFFYKMNETGADGGVPVFTSTHPKWSFAKVNDEGFIDEIQEKNPISDCATVGFYYWNKGSDFVQFAENMIENDIRVNNEFYVAPVYNLAIKQGLKVLPFKVKKMWGIGTPEDLSVFLQAKISK